MTTNPKGSWPFASGNAPEPTTDEAEAQANRLAEQQKLIEVLKFTPRTYRISMWGYGGEKVMGTVDPKVWDYCLKHRVDLVDMAWGDYDEFTEERGLDPDMLPFTPGSWYECDNMGHVNGVSRSAGTLQIEDETGKTIYEKHFDNITGGGMDGEPDWCCNDEIWIGSRKKGEVVFVGSSNEKGTFFEGEIELKAPFNIEKLELHYDEIDGEEIINSVYYDGEEIENYGGSTDGKSSDMDMVRVIDDEGNWERYVVPDEEDIPVLDGEEMQAQEAIDGELNWNPIEELEKIVDQFKKEFGESVPDWTDSDKTDWFDKDIKPAIKGTYEAVIDAEWPLSGIRMVEWTGRSWKEDGEKVKIKSWRGLAENPNV